MARVGFVAAFLLAGTVVTAAALPPYRQRKAEIDAITDSGDVARRLENHGPIDVIEHIGNDHYRWAAAAPSMYLSSTTRAPNRFRARASSSRR
ncbi:hypothetical protein FJW05_05215 [Mesorhizobium sp. B2-9-1]|uniref:hypothetical protein n=1 Tax=unclassified Mesorhizobium TaxID=325217 RepID=UPI00112AE93E|nr:MULTISPECIES: hypothetical protein [unclassified Mesorhizobium]TPI48759.1 hypothetical protein FJW05_05215 [Mesorhizobium sp. B2-9-1]TPJ31041.1 hypothetical protein FJ425_04785 [Mesorhizobium sp. B2-7-2]